MKSLIVPQISIPSSSLNDPSRTPPAMRCTPARLDDARPFVSPARAHVTPKTSLKEDTGDLSVYGFAKAQLDVLRKSPDVTAETPAQSSFCEGRGTFLYGILHLLRRDADHFSAPPQVSAGADGTYGKSPGRGSGLTPPTHKRFCQKPLRNDSPVSARGNASAVRNSVADSSSLLPPASEFSPVSLSMEHWVRTVKLSVSSFLSYTHLRTTLQLLHQSAAHPLILHILSHPSTAERLNRFADTRFLEHVFRRTYHPSSSGAGPSHSRATSTGDTVKVVDSSNGSLAAQFSPRQHEALYLVGLSPSLTSVHKCITHIVSLLDIDVPLALDILLALLLRRRLSMPLVTSACTVGKQDLYKSSADGTNGSELESSQNLHALLNLHFLEADLQSLDWAQASTEKEVLSVFVDEIKAYLDCLSLVTSIHMEPYLRFAETLMKADAAPCNEETGEPASRTQRYYSASAHHSTKRSRHHQAAWGEASRFYAFSILQLRHSLDLRAIRRSLWRCFARLSSLDPGVLESALEPEGGLFRVPENASGAGDGIQDEPSNGSLSQTNEFVSMAFRSTLVLSTYLIGCLTTLLRFAPAEAGYTSLSEAHDACEFIIQRRYLGFLGHLVALQESSIVDLVVANSRSLMTVAQDLGCASAAFLVAVHQLHRISLLNSPWFKSSLEELVSGGPGFPQELRPFHTLFSSNASPPVAVFRDPSGVQGDFWDVVSSISCIATFAHAVFCAGIARSIEQATGRSETSDTPRSPGVRPENSLVDDFTLSVIPDQCLPLAAAFQGMRVTPTLTSVSSPAHCVAELCGELPVSTIPLASPWRNGASDSAADNRLAYSGSLLWSHSTNVLPLYTSLGVADDIESYQLLLPDALRPLPGSRCYSVAGGLRHALFDLVEALITSVELTRLPGLQLLADFASDLFTSDSAIANRAMTHDYWHDAEKPYDRCVRTEEDGPCSGCKAECGCCRSTFWALVVEDHLMSIVPYSIPLLLRVASSLIPAKGSGNGGGAASIGEDMLNKERFRRVMASLVRPCSQICFPPVLPNIIPAPPRRDLCGQAKGRSLELPSWDVPGSSRNVRDVHDGRDPLAAETPFPWTSCKNTARGLREWDPVPLRKASCDVEERSEMLSVQSEASSEHRSKEPLFYAIDGALNLEPLLLEMFGIQRTTPSPSSGYTMIGGSVYGRVVQMPLEPLLWTGLGCPPAVLPSPEVPLVAPSGAAPTRADSSQQVRRRYCGSVWAVGVLTTGCDGVQTWNRPIDPQALNEFVYSFTERCREQFRSAEDLPVSSGYLLRSLTSNPFRRVGEINSVHEPWMAYQMLSLTAGDEVPYTIQWDLTETAVPPSLLRILWDLWSALLEDLSPTLLAGTPGTRLLTSSHLCKINLLVQIVQCFTSFLAASPMGYPVLNRFLFGADFNRGVVPAEGERDSPVTVFFQFYHTARLAIAFASPDANEDAGPLASQRLLLVASLCGLMAAMRPVPLEDLRVALTTPHLDALLLATWSRPSADRLRGAPSAALEPLGPAPDSIHLHWLFRLLCSSRLSAPVLHDERVPQLSFANLVSCVKQIAQSSTQRPLAFLTTVTALQLSAVLMELTPLTAWTRSALDEALTTSQITRETIDALVRSQTGMAGEWNVVENYIRALEQMLWQTISSLLPPSPTTPYDDYAIARDVEKSSLEATACAYRAAVLDQVHRSSDLPLFQMCLDLLFSLGWQQSCSSLATWTVLERTQIFKAFLPVLQLLSSSFTTLNSTLLDRKGAGHSSDENYQETVYDPLIPNFRAVENSILNALAEHNVPASVMGVITCDGYISAAAGDAVSLSTGTGVSSSTPSTCNITQRFTNVYLTQAYFCDLLESQYCSSSTTVLTAATALAATVSLSYPFVCPSIGAVEEAKGVIIGFVRFLVHLATVAYGHCSSSEKSAASHMDLQWGTVDPGPSALFTKLAATLFDPKAGTLLRHSAGCPWGGDLKVSLLSTDVFEGLDHRFMLDIAYERTAGCWAFDVNFIMALVAWMSGWGESTSLCELPLLIRLLFEGRRIYTTVSDGNAGSLAFAEAEDAANPSSLVSHLLVKLPPEFHYYIAKQSKAQGTALQKNASLPADSTMTTAWTLLTDLEATLVTSAINALILVPARLSTVAHTPNDDDLGSLTGESHRLVALQPSVLDIPHFFGLYDASILRQFEKRVAATSPRLKCKHIAQFLVGFVEFWLLHFLAVEEKSVRDGDATQNAVALSRVSLDNLRLVSMCLDLLRRLLGRHAGSVVQWMSLSCSSLLSDAGIAFPLAGGPVRSGGSRSSERITAFPQQLTQLSGWALLERVTTHLLTLWSSAEAFRYSNLSQRLPSTDLSLTEGLYGRVAVPTAFANAYGSRLIPGSSTGIMYTRRLSVNSAPDDSGIESKRQGPVFGDVSFIYLPLLIDCFTRIVSMVSQVVAMPLTASVVDVAAGQGLNVTATAAELSSVKGSLTAGPARSRVQPCSSDIGSDRNTSKRQPKGVGLRAGLVPLLFQSSDFVSLYTTITTNAETAATLFGDTRRLLGSGEASSSHHGCLVPSTLFARLASSWFSLMDKRSLFEVLPSPLCPTCHAAPSHPFSPVDSAVPYPPLDCGFVNGCASPEASQKLLYDLFTLLFGDASRSELGVSTVPDVGNPHAYARLSKKQTVSTPQADRTPSPRRCSSNVLADRVTVFQLALFRFGRHLWDKIIQGNLAETLTQPWTNSDLKEFMTETFALLEISSVMSVELHINRLKHCALLQLTELLKASRAAKVFPLSLPTLCLSSPGAASSSQCPLGSPGTPPNQLKPFRSFALHTAAALLDVVRARADLCGRARDTLFCPNLSAPSCGSLSYAGGLMDFVLQLLTASWESDARTLHVMASAVKHDHHASATHKTPLTRLGASGTALGPSASPLLSADGAHDPPPADGVPHRLPRYELVPHVETVSPDASKGTVCLSSLWQPQMLQRPVARHPDGVWLVHPFCQGVPAFPSIDALEILNHEGPAAVDDPKDTQDTCQPLAYRVFSALLHSLWHRCSVTLKRYALNTSSSKDFGFQSIADFCRSVALVQLLLRTWITGTIERGSAKEDAELIAALSPIASLLRELFYTLLSAMSTLATTLNVAVSNNELSNVALLLLLHGTDHFDGAKSGLSVRRKNVTCAPTDAGVLLALASPILLMAVACTTLETVRASSATRWKRLHQQSACVSPEPTGRQRKTSLAYATEFSAKAEPWSRTFHEFVLGAVSDEASSASHSRQPLLLELASSFLLLTKLSGTKITTTVADARTQKHGSGMKGLSLAPPSSRLRTDMLLSRFALPDPAYSRTYRSIWVASVNFPNLLGMQLSLTALSLVNYLCFSPSVAEHLDRVNLSPALALLPGAVLFTRPLSKALASDSGSFRGSSRPKYNLENAGVTPPGGEYWRPVYERYYSPGVDSAGSGPELSWNAESGCADIGSRTATPVRALGHVVWCRFLLHLCHSQVAQRRNGAEHIRLLETPNGTSAAQSPLVDVVLRFHTRFYCVLETVAQYGQLGLLEELFVIVRVLSKLPPLAAMSGLQEKRMILRLVLTALITVRGLAQLCLGRGQIEMAEVFRPVSLRELYAAGLLDASTTVPSFNGSMDGGTVFAGQAANIPSLYHQRVVVLILKMMQNLLRCVHGLQFDRLSIDELNGLAPAVVSGVHDSIKLRESLGNVGVPNHHHASYDPTETKKEPVVPTGGDMLEVFFHETVDIGRLILQLLEDLPKLQTPVFVAVCTQNTHNVLLPLSLGLRCEQRLRHDMNPLAWLTSGNHIPLTGDVDTLLNGTSATHASAGITQRTVSPRSVHRPYSPLFTPAGGGSANLAPLTTFHAHACVNLETPPTTPKLTSTAVAPWDASTVVSRRSSPLVQRYSTGASGGRGTTGPRLTTPIHFYGRFARTDNTLVECDPVTDDCLPECVTLLSVLRVLQFIVERSLLLSFTFFNRLASVTEQAPPAPDIAVPAQSTFTRPGAPVSATAVFSRSSVVRRLSEFLTALQTTVVERFHHLEPLIEKMMTLISIRLGDDPRTIPVTQRGTSPLRISVNL